MEDQSAFTYNNEKKASSFLMNLLFSHVGIFFLVAGYAAFGAWVFTQLEGPAEMQRYKAKMEKADEVSQTIQYTTEILWYYGDSSKFTWNFENYSLRVQEDLTTLEMFILDGCEKQKYDGHRESWEYQWTYTNTLLFTFTIISTIGYGHITPVTFEGQMFTIMYALIGSPLFLIFLANLGNAMASGFIYIYSRICCRSCRSRRYLSEVPENSSSKARKHVIDDIVGEEEYMPTKEMFVPIIVNIVLLHAYFVVGALMFSNWEGWGLTASYYFSFITLATIGYGDYYPGKGTPIVDDGGSLVSILKMLICLLYIILGLALLSMAISLMQEQIVEKCRWLANEVGMSKSAAPVEGANPAVEGANPDTSPKDPLGAISEGDPGVPSKAILPIESA